MRRSQSYEARPDKRTGGHHTDSDLSKQLSFVIGMERIEYLHFVGKDVIHKIVCDPVIYHFVQDFEALLDQTQRYHWSAGLAATSVFCLAAR